MTIDIWEGVLKRDKATQTETIYQPIDEVPKKKQKTQPIKEVKKKKKENQWTIDNSWGSSFFS